MRYVEVFTTNVCTLVESAQVATCLNSLFEGAHVTFDLDDIDHVLRIASPFAIDADNVTSILATLGFECEVMRDDVSHYTKSKIKKSQILNPKV